MSNYHELLSAACGLQVNACLKARTPVEALAPLVAWDPAPVCVSGYERLRDEYVAALAWRERAEAVLSDQGPVQLKTLEGLAAEASRIRLVLPEAKVLLCMMRLQRLLRSNFIANVFA